MTEVCFALGFSSLGSFSDAFRRRVGVRPSEYRRRVVAAVPRSLRPRGCFGLLGPALAVMATSKKRSPGADANLGP